MAEISSFYDKIDVIENKARLLNTCVQIVEELNTDDYDCNEVMFWTKTAIKSCIPFIAEGIEKNMEYTKKLPLCSSSGMREKVFDNVVKYLKEKNIEIIDLHYHPKLFNVLKFKEKLLLHILDTCEPKFFCVIKLSSPHPNEQTDIWL